MIRGDIRSAPKRDSIANRIGPDKSAYRNVTFAQFSVVNSHAFLTSICVREAMDFNLSLSTVSQDLS